MIVWIEPAKQETDVGFGHGGAADSADGAVGLVMPDVKEDAGSGSGLDRVAIVSNEDTESIRADAPHLFRTMPILRHFQGIDERVVVRRLGIVGADDCRGQDAEGQAGIGF